MWFMPLSFLGTDTMKVGKVGENVIKVRSIGMNNKNDFN